MFVVAQFPLVDLRPLFPGQRGRLVKPDWQSPQLSSGFIRGFGKISERNKSDLGLEGESAFADFNGALRFPTMIDIAEPYWSKRFHANVWFRRLYYDGKMAGRFEVAFMLYDGEEALTYDTSKGGISKIEIDIPRTISIINETAVEVVSQDESIWQGKFSSASQALGMAYIVSTTRNDLITRFPASDIYGRDVVVGSPRYHVIVDGDWQIKEDKAVSEIIVDSERELYLTSVKSSAVRKSIIVNKIMTSGGEGPSGRALRVIFANMNSLVLACGYLTDNYEILRKDNKHNEIKDKIKEMIDRFSDYDPDAEKNADDREFIQALKAFGSTYKRRVPELLERLQEISLELDKPTASEKVGAFIRSAYEIVVKAAVDKAMDMSAGR